MSFSILLAYVLPKTVQAQQSGFTIGLNTVYPNYRLPSKDDDSPTFSGSIELGYRKYLPKTTNASIGAGIYFDLYDCPIQFAEPAKNTSTVLMRKTLYGTTGFTGVSLTPSWCFNPEADWIFALALKVKAGHYFGWGTLQGKDQNGSMITYDKQSAGAGLGMAFSPRLVLEHEAGSKSVQLLAGWDSSDMGRGVSRLRSSFFKPSDVDYRSSAFIIGVALIF